MTDKIPMAMFIKERVELAREQSAFWQNYKWLNPATVKLNPKRRIVRG